jgi:3-oxoacyl-[acyl-carrier protein] reductase
MDSQLQGKKALVTGSSSGIGESIAKFLAKEGVHVMTHGRNEKELNRVVDEIQKAGGKAAKIQADLATDEGAKKVARATVEALGGIDILINNAGAYPKRGWKNTSPQDWLDLFNQNVVSAVRLILEFLPMMRKQKYGRFIQFGSVLGTRPFADGADYAVTKSAHILISVSLSRELAGTGITANTISPGPIRTPGVEDFFRKIAQEKGWGSKWEEIEANFIKEIGSIPSNRLGKPEEIAAAVAFIASPLASYINGANIRVDGGGSFCVN